MARLGPRIAALCYLTLGAGCSKPQPLPEPGIPSRALAHVGEWQGSGMAFPAGKLCLVFCTNNLFFAADTTCDDTAHPDFQRDWTWSRTPDGMLHAHRPDGTSMPMRFRTRESREEALVDLPGHPALPLTRVGDLSSVCLK